MPRRLRHKNIAVVRVSFTCRFFPRFRCRLGIPPGPHILYLAGQHHSNSDADKVYISFSCAHLLVAKIPDEKKKKTTVTSPVAGWTVLFAPCIEFELFTGGEGVFRSPLTLLLLLLPLTVIVVVVAAPVTMRRSPVKWSSAEVVAVEVEVEWDERFVSILCSFLSVGQLVIHDTQRSYREMLLNRINSDCSTCPGQNHLHLFSAAAAARDCGPR